MYHFIMTYAKIFRHEKFSIYFISSQNRQLRKGRGQQTLLNLSLALLCSMVIFLAGMERTDSYYGCITVAALMHYFLLVSFMWMLVEGFLQYLRFVRVLGTYVPRFILKASIPAWGRSNICPIIKRNYQK